ncbi:hypothetical protein, partial [Mesorhizobium sp.]|uniref:hypothetical protein n=1 Tax=Mesorhizobium sp. TaxID=1871066 RepID=UPI0025C198BF
NHAFEGKMSVRFVPRFSRENAQLVGANCLILRFEKGCRWSWCSWSWIGGKPAFQRFQVSFSSLFGGFSP